MAIFINMLTISHKSMVPMALVEQRVNQLSQQQFEGVEAHFNTVTSIFNENQLIAHKLSVETCFVFCMRGKGENLLRVVSINSLS